MKLKHLLLSILVAIPLLVSAQQSTNLYQGGTGWSTSTKGDLLIGTSSSLLRYTRLPIGSAGYVLQSVSGQPSWVATSSLGISGGSSSGNSAWTIGNGVIYNATNTDLVGIGTSTPVYKLDILSSGLTKGLRLIASSTNFSPYLTFSGNSTKTSFAQKNTSFQIGNGDADSFSAYIYMLNSGGKVGINSSVPVSQFEVNGNVGIGLNYAATVAAPTNGLIVEGNTGIGTSSPTQKLHIGGGMRLEGQFKDSTNASGTSGQVLTSTGTSTLWSTLAGSGTVTSVSLTAPTGLTAASTTCTAACQLALTLTAGYNIPLTASTTNWNNFYNSTSTGTGGLVKQYSPTIVTPTILDALISSVQAFTTSAGVLIKNNAGVSVASFGVGSSGSTNIALIGNTAVTGTLSVTATSTFATTTINGSSNFTGLVTFANASSTGVSTLPTIFSTTALNVRGLFNDSTNASGTANMILRSTGTSTQWVSTSSLFGTPSTGTVTSVGLSMPTGYTVTNSPVTTTGTLTASVTAGYTGPFTTATGTTGSNFNIATTSSSLTINCPDASASNRGCLTSTDWSTFNNKQATLSGGVIGKVTRWLTSSTIGTGLFIDNGTVTGVNATSSTVTFNVQGNAGTSDAFNVASSTGTSIFKVGSNGRLLVGTTTNSNSAHVVIDTGTSASSNEGVNIYGNKNDYFEDNVFNLSNGTGSQACRTATGNNGNLTSGFISICANSSTFNNPTAYNTGGAGDTSIMSYNTGNFIINNATTTKSILFVTGGTATSTNTRMAINGGGQVLVATTSTTYGLNVGTTTGLLATTINGTLTQSGGTVSIATTTVNGNLTHTGAIIPRVVGYTASSTITIDVNTTDEATTTVNQTTTFANPTGTAIDGFMYLMTVRATTTQTISWGSAFASSTDLAYPLTVASGTTEILWKYDLQRGKYLLLGLLKTFAN